MLIGKVTEGNKIKFIDKLFEGVLFETSKTISHEDITKICLDNGILIKYCDYGTNEYAKYGARTYKVIKEDLNHNINNCLQKLSETKSRTLLVKKASLRGNRVLNAGSITFKDKPRTKACRLKVLNALFVEGSIEMTSKLLKSGKYNCEFRMVNSRNSELI